MPDKEAEGGTRRFFMQAPLLSIESLFLQTLSPQTKICGKEFHIKERLQASDFLLKNWRECVPMQGEKKDAH